MSDEQVTNTDLLEAVNTAIGHIQDSQAQTVEAVSALYSHNTSDEAHGINEEGSAFNTAITETVESIATDENSVLGEAISSAIENLAADEDSAFSTALSGAVENLLDSEESTVREAVQTVVENTIASNLGDDESELFPSATSDVEGFVRFATDEEVESQADVYAAVKPSQLSAFSTTDTKPQVGVCLDGLTYKRVDEDGVGVLEWDRPNFDVAMPWAGMEEVVIDGQNMIKIPKFYVKDGLIPSGVNEGKWQWCISDTEKEGYEVHPAFMYNGVEVDCFYYGKYAASLSGTMLQSVAGVAPKVSITQTAAITYAENRNVDGISGFSIINIWQWNAIQWLYLLEYADADCQSTLGRGRVDTTSAANVDADDVAEATYRGMVGLWGNVHQWAQGLKVQSGAISVWDKLGNKTWVTTEATAPSTGAWKYPETLQQGEALSLLFIPATEAASETYAIIKDACYWNTGSSEYVPRVGGHWGDGSYCGLWTLSCNNGASYSNTSIGTRLAKV